MRDAAGAAQTVFAQIPAAAVAPQDPRQKRESDVAAAIRTRMNRVTIPKHNVPFGIFYIIN